MSQYQVQVFVREEDADEEGLVEGWNVLDWTPNKRDAERSYNHYRKMFREVQLVELTAIRSQDY